MNHMKKIIKGDNHNYLMSYSEKQFFLFKRPENKYFMLCEPNGFCYIYSILPYSTKVAIETK